MLASVNGGVDLQRLIEDGRLGKESVWEDSMSELRWLAGEFVDDERQLRAGADHGGRFGRSIVPPVAATR